MVDLQGEVAEEGHGSHYAEAFFAAEFSNVVDAAGPGRAGDFLARHTRVGSVQRGVLLVQVANSTVAQELSFQKTAILERLRELAPDERLDDLRCRVGPLD